MFRFQAMLRACSWLLLAAAIHTAQAQTPTYATANWDGNRIHILGPDFESISEFPAGASSPNGIAFDDQYIYSAHFSNNTMYAYEMDGTIAFEWTSPDLGSVQSLTYIAATNELAFNDGSNNLIFVDPTDGTQTGTLDANVGCSGLEGMASDGAGGVWLLCNEGLFLIDGTTGDEISSSSSPTTGDCSFNGTALALADNGLLALGCTNGDWFLWNPATETTVDSGNNGIQMYGLTPLGIDPPAPPPAPVPVPAGNVLSWVILAFVLLLMATLVLRQEQRRFSA